MTFNAGLGIGNFPFADGDGFWEWVDLCEAGGVGTLWQSDRLVGREPNLECMSVMAALAGRTRRIRFGMNVASLGLRDPFILAKACATIDVLSGGRILPMVAVGSAIGSDYRARGVETKGRGQRTDEGLEIMTRLWTEAEVDFDGKHYQYRGASIAPHPVQKPMPLWVGGIAPAAIERTARWGTGWQGGLETAEQVKPVVDGIKERLLVHGRSIDEDHYGAGFAYRFGAPADAACAKTLAALEKRLGRDGREYVAIGGADEIMQRVHEYRDAGIHKFVLRPIADGTADMMEQTQRLIDEVLPAIAAMNQAAAA